MKEIIIKTIEQKMCASLNNAQNQRLHEVLTHCFYEVSITPNKDYNRNKQ